MADLTAHHPIGVFDSGIGGLTVLKEVRKKMPREWLVYLADQAHIPYGPKSKRAILDYSFEITRFLIDKKCKIIVVACNTASAAALLELREKFPQIDFVGMEPAVKPAAEHSQTGVVGVLATPSTFEGELYASVVSRFAQGATILKHTCPGLVEEIEAGRQHGAKARDILTAALAPMMAQGLDSIVLGCTHYPYTKKVIREIVGQDIEIFDPAPAIANRVYALLDEANLLNQATGFPQMNVFTSGDPDPLEQTIRAKFPDAQMRIQKIEWIDGAIEAAA